MKHNSIAAIAAATGMVVVPSPSATTPDTDVTQDPELAAALDSVAIVDFSDVNLVLVDDAASSCETVDSAGCYDPDTRTIVVASNGDDGPSTTVLAHEFLHHVWVRENLADDDALVAVLASLDAPGSLLHRAIADSYRDEDGQAPATERFAYACTKLKPAQLVPAVASVCERYLDVDALPISHVFTSDEIVATINKRRAGAGLAPMTANAGGERAAQARLDTFTSTDQSSIGTWPDSITTHLGSCDPVDQAILLTDYRGIDIAVDALDEAVNGALTSANRTTVGVAMRDFEVIDGEIDPTDEADDVNMTVIVVMACP